MASTANCPFHRPGVTFQLPHRQPCSHGNGSKNPTHFTCKCHTAQHARCKCKLAPAAVTWDGGRQTQQLQAAKCTELTQQRALPPAVQGVMHQTDPAAAWQLAIHNSINVPRVASCHKNPLHTLSSTCCNPNPCCDSTRSINRCIVHTKSGASRPPRHTAWPKLSQQSCQ